MRGSKSSAACSARRARSIFSSGDRSCPVGSARSRSGSGGCASSAASGSPASSSGLVIRASDTASSTSRPTDSRLRSEVEAAATDCPTNTRSARRCSRACLTVSTWPRRTRAEKACASTMKASAAVAPFVVARARRSASRSSIRPACPRRSCRRSGSSAAPRPRAPTARPCRRCRRPRRAAGRSRRGRSGSAPPGRCRSGSHPSPAP